VSPFRFLSATDEKSFLAVFRWNPVPETGFFSVCKSSQLCFSRMLKHKTGLQKVFSHQNRRKVAFFYRETYHFEKLLVQNQGLLTSKAFVTSIGKRLSLFFSPPVLSNTFTSEKGTKKIATRCG